MVQAIIYFPDEIDKKVREYADKWDLSKHDTVIRMIKEYLERRSQNAVS